MRIALALLLLTGSSALAGTTDIKMQTRQVLDAYARGDSAGVLALSDPEAITVYGSDAAEVFHGAAALKTMLAYDQRLWGGAAQIGPLDHVNLVETKDLASIFFDAPFSVGGRPPLPVRFAMTWRRTGKRWLLVQSSNVVPTQGQSARQLLEGSGNTPR